MSLGVEVRVLAPEPNIGGAMSETEKEDIYSSISVGIKYKDGLIEKLNYYIHAAFENYLLITFGNDVESESIALIKKTNPLNDDYGSYEFEEMVFKIDIWSIQTDDSNDSPEERAKKICDTIISDLFLRKIKQRP